MYYKFIRQMVRSMCSDCARAAVAAASRLFCLYFLLRFSDENAQFFSPWITAILSHVEQILIYLLIQLMRFVVRVLAAARLLFFPPKR
jgi:hypothetical protein